MLLCNFAGLTGVALLTATVLGANLSWTILLTYAAVTATGLDAGWHTLWLWRGHRTRWCSPRRTLTAR